MPPRIPRACRKRGCAKTTTDHSGYCNEHINTGWENHQQGKGVTNAATEPNGTNSER